jgi:hypothetical protein
MWQGGEKLYIWVALNHYSNLNMLISITEYVIHHFVCLWVWLGLEHTACEGIPTSNVRGCGVT